MSNLKDNLKMLFSSQAEATNVGKVHQSFGGVARNIAGTKKFSS